MDQSTKTMATLSLVLSIVSLFVLAVLMAPAAIVLGTIAGSRGSSMGWWGMGIGIFSLLSWFLLFSAGVI